MKVSLAPNKGFQPINIRLENRVEPRIIHHALVYLYDCWGQPNSIHPAGETQDILLGMIKALEAFAEGKCNS